MAGGLRGQGTGGCVDYLGHIGTPGASVAAGPFSGLHSHRDGGIIWILVIHVFLVYRGERVGILRWGFRLNEPESFKEMIKNSCNKILINNESSGTESTEMVYVIILLDHQYLASLAGTLK